MLETLKASYILGKIRVAHVNDGRIRVVYDRLKHDDDAYADICATLDTYHEITTWSVNRTTGSIVINYDPDKIKSGTFAARLIDGARARYFGGK
ncbi:MAG: hypothetical protein IJ228_11935 [Succinivibrio sp.]|nr:hypothetical protein [Succinivibrio sp.]